MASKKYAYYNKGNKVAIVQQDNSEAHCSLSGYENKTDCEAAGGTWYSSGSFSGSTSTYGRYGSPQQSVSEGLEIEYTYAPTFSISDSSINDADYAALSGYGSDGNYLVFFASRRSAIIDLNAVMTVDRYIYVDSGTWKGIHKIK